MMIIKRFLGLYTQYFTVWVVLCGVLAYNYPEPFVALRGGMQLFFGLTMFGIGAVLEVEDFRRIARRPMIVFIGSAAQFSIMPLGAWALVHLMNLPDEIAVGLILTGAAPGAMASNVMCYIAKADTAYSVSLTTVSTLLCPILTPGLTYLLAREKMDVQFVSMFLSVVYSVVLPLGAGFAVRHFFKRWIDRILPVFPALSASFIIFICSLVIALNRDRLAAMTLPILAAAIILNVYGMSMGYTVGKAFRMGLTRQRTLAIEIGMQNAGLGVVLALKYLSEEAAMPAAIFVFVCIISASFVSSWWQRQDLAQAEAMSTAG